MPLTRPYVLYLFHLTQSNINLHIFVNVTQHERLCQDVHLIFIVTTTSTYVIFHTLLTSLFTVLNLWEVAESDIRPDTTLKHVLKVL